MSSVIKSDYVILNKLSSPITNDDESPKRNEEDLEEIKKRFIQEAREKAETIIMEAKKKSDKYVEEAYDKSKEVLQKAKSQGYEEGYLKGYQEGKKTSDQLILEANTIKKENLLYRESILKNAEEEVIQLVINSCEEILNIKLNEDKESMIAIISKGLDNLSISDHLTIRIAREDYDIVDLSKERILAMASLVEDITLKIDHTLKKGDCIIETAKGSVDVSLSSQINELKSVLYNLLNSE